MNPIFELSLRELQVLHNGVSAQDIRKAANVVEIIFHYPNASIPKATTIKDLRLISGKESLTWAATYYAQELDKVTPPLSPEEKARLIDLNNFKLAIDASLFKLEIQGDPLLEITVSVAESISSLEKILSETLGIAVTVAVSSIPSIGSVVSGLLGPTINSVFNPSDDRKLKSIGKAYLRFSQIQGGDAPIPLIIPESVEIRPIRHWQFAGSSGAEIAVLEPGRTLKQGSLNGYLKLGLQR